MIREGGDMINWIFQLAIIICILFTGCASEVDTLVAEASKLSESGKLVKANALLEKATTMEPGNVVAWEHRSMVSLALKNIDSALLAANQTIELEPQSFYGWFVKGTSLEFLDRPHEAIPALTKATTINPNHSGAWLIRGRCCLSTRAFKCAEVSYSQALSLKPADGTALAGRGITRYYQGNYKDSMVDLEQAVKIDQNNADAWEHIGKLCQMFRMQSEARQAFQMAVKAREKKQ